MVTKDLIVSVSTNEQGVEATLRSTRTLSGFVLLNHEGGRVALKLDELKEALNALEEFIKDNHGEVTPDTNDEVIQVTEITTEFGGDSPRSFAGRFQPHFLPKPRNLTPPLWPD